MHEVTITFRGIAFQAQYDAGQAMVFNPTHKGTDFSEFFTDELWNELDREVLEQLKIDNQL